MTTQAPPTTPALCIKNLGKHYPLPSRSLFKKKPSNPQHSALNNFQLTLAPGEIHALIGPNGSGKSTTLKLILGLLQVSSGSIHIYGKHHHQSPTIKSLLGYLPDNPVHYPQLTGKQLLHFYAKLSKLSKKHYPKRCLEVLEQTQLAHVADQPIHTYSKGMCQRLNLAQAILHQPKLLLLDEPTTGLDPTGTQELFTLLNQLRHKNTAILLTSHHLQALEENCDSITLLHQGNTLIQGRLTQLLKSQSQNSLLDLYLHSLRTLNTPNPTNP